MRRITNRPLLSAALVLLVGLLAFAPRVHAEFDLEAKYAGDYLTGQSNARLLALGGAGTAISGGTGAVLANPARIGIETAHAASFMHADRFESAVKMDYATYVRRLPGDRHIGFGLVRQGVDDIPVTRLRDPSQDIGQDNRVIRTGSTSASEYAFLLSYALDDQDYGRFGASAKLLYKRLDDTNGFGLGVDVGYTNRFNRLHVGAQLRDAITSVLTWGTGRQEVIYPSLRVGAAYEISWERMQAVLLPVLELQVRGESLGDADMLAVHSGLEIQVRDLVAVRVGYDGGRRSNIEAPDGSTQSHADALTYGAGLRINGIALDYAFVGHDDLGATHRVSLSVLWGG